MGIIHFLLAIIIIMSANLYAQGSSAQTLKQIHEGESTISFIEITLPDDRLRLFLKNDKGKVFGNFSNLKKHLQEQKLNLLFAMNGGMYHADYEPVGLYIENGKIIKNINLDDAAGNFFLKPNGVFGFSKDKAFVVPSEEFSIEKYKPLFATQSGPLLLHNKQIHPKFNPESQSHQIRNGVGVRGDKTIIFAISDTPVTLYQFAKIFRDSLSCENALFLDGAISALYMDKLRERDGIEKLGPIIGLVEKREH